MVVKGWMVTEQAAAAESYAAVRSTLRASPLYHYPNGVLALSKPEAVYLVSGKLSSSMYMQGGATIKHTAGARGPR